MRFKNTGKFLLLFGLFLPQWATAAPIPYQQSSAAPAAAKVVGTIQSLSANSLVVKSDEGADRSVAVQDGTHFLQVNPGERDLKKSVPIHLQDLQAGDRVLVLGKNGEDGKTIAAGYVIVMKKIDLEAQHHSEQQDWQKRGVGGLVDKVDPATGDVTISLMVAGQKKEITVHTTKATVIRRYAPDSVKFDDAQPSTLAAIQPGDQLRARGTRSEDGTQLTAEEIVGGSFRNIAGTISAIDAAAGTMTVADNISKKTVEVKVTSESKLRKLPAPMAHRLAVRLKGEAGEGSNGKPPEQASAANHTANGSGEAAPGHATGDLQQVLSRLPASGLSDFQKGDAVMIVSTEGAGADEVTAITVLGGVEPILTAAPKGSKEMVISPWSLSAPQGGG